jgi:hypothetical protein
MMPCRRPGRRIVSENRRTKFQVSIKPASAHLEITRSEFRMVAGESIFSRDAIHIAVCCRHASHLPLGDITDPDRFFTPA